MIPIRPDTGDGRSLPCARCGRRTPDAMYVCGVPTCDECSAERGTGCIYIDGVPDCEDCREPATDGGAAS